MIFEKNIKLDNLFKKLVPRSQNEYKHKAARDAARLSKVFLLRCLRHVTHIMEIETYV